MTIHNNFRRANARAILLVDMYLIREAGTCFHFWDPFTFGTHPNSLLGFLHFYKMFMYAKIIARIT
jgi:hypothetical protein